MVNMNGFKIIGVDHGFGNIKTAGHCFPTGIIASDTEPVFTRNLLVYEGHYYLIGEGHKEYLPEKIVDDDYYILTLAAIARIKSQLSGVNLVADIGNGTMNVLYIINGQPQSGKMFTEKFGVYQCTLAVREAFLRQTRRELNDAIIDEIFRTGTANIRESDLAIVRATAAEYVAEIFRRLRDHGYDKDTMMLVITGGGGCLIKRFYQFDAARVRFIDDICAAAKGYEYMAELQIKAGQA